MDSELYKSRVSRICQVRMGVFVGASNPQVAGSIPAEGAKRFTRVDALLDVQFVE
jgi:hypothetical protein